MSKLCGPLFRLSATSISPKRVGFGQGMRLVSGRAQCRRRHGPWPKSRLGSRPGEALQSDAQLEPAQSTVPSHAQDVREPWLSCLCICLRQLSGLRLSWAVVKVPGPSLPGESMRGHTHTRAFVRGYMNTHAPGVCSASWTWSPVHAASCVVPGEFV